VIKVRGKSRKVPAKLSPTDVAFLAALAPDRYIWGGAVLFAEWEDWNLLDGSYFCFISLSTIGFGDIVPGDKIYYGQGLELSFIFCSMYLMLGESAPRAFSGGYRSRMESRVCSWSLISKVDPSLGETSELEAPFEEQNRARFSNRARLWRQTEKIGSFFSSSPPFPLPRRKNPIAGGFSARREDNHFKRDQLQSSKSGNAIALAANGASSPFQSIADRWADFSRGYSSECSRVL